MTPGWGSSGYYSNDVVEAAGKERIFPAGTHMYVNHPSAQEAQDRPERDLNGLAAVLAEDAYWSPDQNRLQAEVLVFSHWRKPLAEMAPHIGVSIRGSAEVTEGEAEGRKGTIITRLTEGGSVDFVTKAGRGGQVLNVLESALASEAMSNDVRDSLNQLVRDTYRTEDRYAWTRDYDPDAGLVYFELEGETGGGLFRQNYTSTADGLPSALTGEREEVKIVTTYVPVAPAGQSTPTQEAVMPQIEEARLRALETDAGRVPVLETERDAALQRAEEAEKRATTALATANKASAARIVGEAFSTAGVTAPKTIERLAESFPTTEDGTVDEDALRTLAEESAAEIAEASGVGGVRNLGQSAETGDDISESDLDAELAKLSGRTTVKEA
jgi:hypothetical protein